MPDQSLTIEESLRLIVDAPERIAALTANLTPEQLRTPPGDGEWSLNDVLAHIRACADVWGDNIAVILAKDHPTIRAMSPRTWMTKTDYPDLDFRPSLQAYTDQRAALMIVLTPLPPESWARTATVKGAGKTLIRTVHSYAESIALHERPHLKQMASIAKAIQQAQ